MTLRYYYLLLVFMISVALPTSVGAQGVEAWRDISIKTNLLYGAAATPNLGAEVMFSPRWSLEVSGSYNPFTFSDNKKWKHWFVQPEVRFWNHEVYKGHFFAAHALIGEYNVGNVDLPFGIYKGTRDHRYEGMGMGLGVGYGYRQPLGKGWSLEGEVGVGYVYSRFDRYDCRICGEFQGKGHKNYLGPTKLAINLVYTLPLRARKKVVPAPIILRDTIVARDTVFVPAPVDTVKLVEPVVPVVDTLRKDSASFSLMLHYKPGTAAVYRELGNNDVQFTNLSAFLDRQLSDTILPFRTIRIIGCCSVEGLVATNDRISLERAKSVAAYIYKLYPKMTDKLIVEGVGEDWAGLQQLIEQHADGFRGREEALRIIREVSVWEGRERQLMLLNGGVTYQWMRKTLFPRLRRVECRIDYRSKE